jgi:hypothetical protein
MRKLLLVLPVVAFVVVGCIDYEQETTLHMDGSGHADIHYSLVVVEAFADESIPTDEDDIKTRYKGEPGIKVSNVEVTTENEAIDVSYRIDFDDFDRFLEVHDGMLDPSRTTFTSGAGRWKFFGVATGGDKETWPDERTNEGTYSLLNAYHVTYTFNFPGEVTSTNGEITDDYDTVVWSYTLADVMTGEFPMEAEGEEAEFPLDFVIGIIVAVLVVLICAVLIVVLIIVVIVLIVRKGKKRKTV